MDTPPDPAADRVQALDLLRELAALLRHERMDFWLKHVRTVGGLLEPMEDTSAVAVENAMREAGRAWRDMNRGAGSFLEYHADGTDRELVAVTEPLRSVFERYR